jgi:DNA polymerase-3 subunit epsilon
MFGIRRWLGRKSGVELTSTWPFDSGGGFVVIDFETTGLSPLHDRAVEVGLIKMDNDGQPVAYFQTLINPERPVAATHIHGITDADVANSPTFGQISEELIKRLQSHVLVGHNLHFDMAFLDGELGRVGLQIPLDYPTICTQQTARVLLPGLARYRLIDCAKALGLDNQSAHRALKDAAMTAGLLHGFLRSKVDSSLVDGLHSLTSEARGITWSTQRGAVRSAPARPQQSQVPSRGDEREAVKGLLAGVSDIAPEDFLADNPSSATLAYSELLLTALEDGQVSADEMKALEDLATSLGLSVGDTSNIKQSMLGYVAREAWRDGKVSRDEKSDVAALASFLQLDEKAAKAALADAEQARIDRMSRRTVALPPDWDLGIPLQVDDRIVFTGCYDCGRDDMEEKATRAGLRVTGSVSPKTKLLVSDGTIGGVKDSNAQKLGTRTVDPATFARLLQYVQPKTDVSKSSGKPKRKRATPREPKTETLICTRCAASFSRTATRGRKPHECPDCRAQTKSGK